MSVLHFEKVLATCILPRVQFLRAYRRIAPIGASNRKRVVLFRIDDLIPNRYSYPALLSAGWGYHRSPVAAGCLVGWLAGWLGHQNASKTCTLRQKVRQKRVPLGKKSFPKRGCLFGYRRNPKIIFSQNCIDFDTKAYRFGYISGPS